MSAIGATNIGAACDQVLSEIIADALDMHSAADEIASAWPPWTHDLASSSSGEPQTSVPAQGSDKVQDRRLKGAKTTKSPRDSCSPVRSRSPDGHKSPRPNQGVLTTRRSLGPAPSYSQLHHIRNVRRSQELLAAVTEPPAGSTHHLRQSLPRVASTRTAQDVHIQELLPILQPAEGLATPPALFLNDRLVWELEQQEAALEAELGAAAQAAELELAREERSMDRALRDAGVHPDDDTAPTLESAEAYVQPGSQQPAPEELPHSHDTGEHQAQGFSGAAGHEAVEQGNGAAQRSQSVSLQPLLRVDSEEVMARAEALDSPLAQARRVLPVEGEAGSTAADYTQMSVFAAQAADSDQVQQHSMEQPRGMELQQGPVQMHLYMHGADVAGKGGAQGPEIHPAAAVSHADQPMHEPSGSQQGISDSETREQEDDSEFSSPEAKEFREAQRQRSRAIAEQLARLQEESRMLQEQSRALQERAVAIQREAGVEGLLRNQAVRSLPPQAHETHQPAAKSARSAKHPHPHGEGQPLSGRSKSSPDDAQRSLQPANPKPSLAPAPSTQLVPAPSKPGSITWGLPQRKPGAHAPAPKQPSQAVPPHISSTPPGPIPSRSPEPSVSYTKVMDGYGAGASDDNAVLRRQGSSTSTIEPLLPRWADQLASSENSPLGSPQHYRRYNSPLKTHPSPDRKKRLLQQQQQERQQEQLKQQPADASHSQQQPGAVTHSKQVDAAAGPSPTYPQPSVTDYSQPHKPRKFLPEVRLPLLLQPPQQPPPAQQAWAAGQQPPPAPHAVQQPKVGFAPGPRMEPLMQAPVPLAIPSMWPQSYMPMQPAHVAVPGMQPMPAAYGMWGGVAPPAYMMQPPPPLAAEHSSDSVGSQHKPVPHKPAAKRTVKSGRLRNGVHAPTKANPSNGEAPPFPHLQQLQQQRIQAVDAAPNLPPLGVMAAQPYGNPAAMLPAYGPYTQIGVWPGGMMPSQQYMPHPAPSGGAASKAPGQLSPRDQRQHPAQQRGPAGKQPPPSIYPHAAAPFGFYDQIAQPISYQTESMPGWAQPYGAQPPLSHLPAKAAFTYPLPAVQGFSYGAGPGLVHPSDALYAAQMLQRAQEIQAGQQQRLHQVEGEVLARLDRHAGAGAHKHGQQSKAAEAPRWRNF